MYFTSCKTLDELRAEYRRDTWVPPYGCCANMEETLSVTFGDSSGKGRTKGCGGTCQVRRRFGDSPLRRLRRQLSQRESQGVRY